MTALLLAGVLLLAPEPGWVDVDQRSAPVLVTRPEGKGPFPLLVIAPAMKYTMKGALFEQLAEVGSQRLGPYQRRRSQLWSARTCG